MYLSNMPSQEPASFSAFAQPWRKDEWKRVGGSHSSASFAQGPHRSRHPGRPVSAHPACSSDTSSSCAPGVAHAEQLVTLPTKSLNMALLRYDNNTRSLLPLY
jgi:hypothetical protein